MSSTFLWPRNCAHLRGPAIGLRGGVPGNRPDPGHATGCRRHHSGCTRSDCCAQCEVSGRRQMKMPSPASSSRRLVSCRVQVHGPGIKSPTPASRRVAVSSRSYRSGDRKCHVLLRCLALAVARIFCAGESVFLRLRSAAATVGVGYQSPGDRCPSSRAISGAYPVSSECQFPGDSVVPAPCVIDGT